ncbi:MAG TPA: TolC family protein, partial [Candidatus Binatia bacterium]|nr:TolC family protein [Candidatus Binatia bacterium]
GLLACGAPSSAYAQGSDIDFTAAVDLPDLRSYTLARNPEIQAMRERWRAAQARPSQEGSLADPMVSTAYHNESFDRFSQGSSDFSFLRFGVEQEVPFLGKLGLKQEVAARAADREGALYRAAVLDVLTRLRVAYDDYFLAHQSLEIVRKNRALLEKLEQAAEARYKVGEGTQQDVLRAQVELSILLGRLTSLEQARESSAAKLNALVNRPPTAPFGPPTPIRKEPLQHSLEELEALARERSPNLKAADLDVARAESNLALAKRQYYPDFVLRADYFNKAALVPEWEVGAGIRIPLFFWRKQAFGVEEAAAGKSEARAARQAVAQDVLSKLKDFYAQAEAADRLVGLYGTAVVPQSELSLDSALASYQVGQVDFLTVLNNFTVLNEYRVSYYEQLANFDKAVAELDQAAGVFPEEVSGGKP